MGSLYPASDPGVAEDGVQEVDPRDFQTTWREESRLNPHEDPRGSLIEARGSPLVARVGRGAGGSRVIFT